jgi:DNA primase small subunit
LGSDKNQKVGLTLPLHPMLERSYKTLEPLFVKHVLPSSGHGILANEKQWTELLQTLPPAAEIVRDKLLQKWKSTETSTTPAEKWIELKKHLNIFANLNKQQGKAKSQKTLSTADKSAIELWPIATVFTYTYPRLDINVSKMQNHLLKSPFCVHPKTGRVCVPIDPKNVDEFDPFNVPTLGQLEQELNAYEQNNDGEEDEKRIKYDWQKTSLKEHFEPFQKQFLDPLWKDRLRAQREAAEAQAAMTGDF